MPSPRRVAWAQLKVGIMALVAMAIVAVLVFLLTGDQSLFSKEVVLYTYMDDSAALTEGSAVRLNGILIGKVTGIDLTGETQPNRIVRMTMQVQEDKLPQIPVDSMAAIGAENVLGTKFINIKKGRSAQTIRAGGTVPSLDTRDFEEVVQSSYALLTSLQGILKRVDVLVGAMETGQGSIGKLIVDDELYNRLIEMEKDVQKFTSGLASEKGTLGRLLYDDQFYQEIRGSLARVDRLLEDLQQGQGTAGKLLKDPALYDDLRKTLAEVKTLMADLNAGKGTAGQLLKSDKLAKEVSGLLAKIDTTVDRVNSGQGTIGQLLVNQQLYDNINGLTHEMTGLMKDFRSNPAKFLRIKLALF